MLLVGSSRSYLSDHFDLTADFGQYSQAWQQIATGHLNPYDTTYPWNYPHYGYPFYQSDFELIMWPLAVFYWVWPHGVDLLIVQDATLAGAGLVAYRWALEHLQVHAPNRRFAVAIASCVGAVLVLPRGPTGPRHMTITPSRSPRSSSCSLAAIFGTTAGVAGFSWSWLCSAPMWPGRTWSRSGWSRSSVDGNVGALGLILLGVGVVWLAIVGLVHSGDGAVLSDYAYLDNKTNVNDNVGGIATILSGMLFHPSIAGHVITSRWGEIYKFIGGAGTIGFFSVFGGLFSIIVLAPSALNSSPAFISDIGGSQNIMAVMAVAVGIAMVATWFTRLGARLDGRWPIGLTALALALAAGAVIQTAVLSAHWTPKSGQMFAAVDNATAAELARVEAQIPASGEAVVSQGVVGRFAQRHTFYPYFDVFADGQTVPLFGHSVYVVLVPRQGVEQATPTGTMNAVTLMRHLGAHRARRTGQRL